MSGSEFAAKAAALEVENGQEMNGSVFNGIMFNGIMFNGIMFNGIMFNGIMFNGIMFNGIMFNGTRSTDGVAVSGTQIMNVGTTMKGKLSNNATIDLRVDGLSYDSGTDLTWYNVKVSTDGGVNWGPLCAGGVGAIPINNRWDAGSASRIADSSMFTFACDGAALAKCEKWGYKADKKKKETRGGTDKFQDLDAWHQACTRLVRADYCGDGISHTRNGTAIDVYDNLSVQTRDGNVGALEADWTPSGARCIRHTRFTLAAPLTTGEPTDLAYVQAHCSNNLAANDASCGGDPNTTGVDNTSYPTANGFDVDPWTRNVLRNDSNTGQ